MSELELNRDTVQTIIDKAQQFHAKAEVTFPEDPNRLSRTAEYLIGTPLVADYLAAGLDQIEAA